MAKVLDSKIPAGPVAEKWKEYKAHQRLAELLHSGLSPSCSLYCRSGWYQRCQVLSERR